MGMASACAGNPTLKDRFLELNGEAKSQYLTIYPELTPDERLAYLDLGANPRIFQELRPHFSLLNAGKISKLEILPSKDLISSSEPWTIREGHSLPLKAITHYTDRRVADVTEDADWDVQPRLAKMDKSTLRWNCISQAVVVSADFFREAGGTQEIRIELPLRELKLELDPRAQGGDQSEYIQLRLIAECEDGTQSEVACQAAWNTDEKDVAEVTGCGRIRLLRTENMHGRLLRVTAGYGSKTITKELHLPQKR